MHPLVAIVIPCLNEEKLLRSTCQSLGFGTSKLTNPNIYLFIVDNGSTDNTLNVAYELKANSPSEQVIVDREDERGYVPPRHKGNLLVSELARKKSVDLADVFLFQADADVQYSPGYIDAMTSALLVADHGTLVEGISQYSPDFLSEYPLFVEICNALDSMLSPLFVNEDLDVVVDDKMVGYRLSDYFKWGGLTREYLDNDEVHAETTRLFMRAKAFGGKRSMIEGAVAHHSMRKVKENPALFFATAGFPRENKWLTQWMTQFPNNIKLKNFPNTKPKQIKRINFVRLQHLLALFTVLPFHVNRTLKGNFSFSAFEQEFENELPSRKLDDLLHGPAVFIQDAFSLVQKKGEEFVSKAIFYAS